MGNHVPPILQSLKQGRHLSSRARHSERDRGVKPKARPHIGSNSFMDGVIKYRTCSTGPSATGNIFAWSHTSSNGRQLLMRACPPGNRHQTASVPCKPARVTRWFATELQAGISRQILQRACLGAHLHAAQHALDRLHQPSAVSLPPIACKQSNVAFFIRTRPA